MAVCNNENTRPGVSSGNKKTFQYRKKSSGAGKDPNTVNPRKKDTNNNQKSIPKISIGK